MKAIQRHCLRMCNENETRLLWKNLYSKCNFFRTIKICRKITFVILTSELSYYNHKGKGQKDKQRSTKHAYKTKYRLTRMPLKTGVNAGAPGG